MTLPPRSTAISARIWAHYRIVLRRRPWRRRVNRAALLRVERSLLVPLREGGADLVIQVALAAVRVRLARALLRAAGRARLAGYGRVQADHVKVLDEREEQGQEVTHVAAKIGEGLRVHVDAEAEDREALLAEELHNGRRDSAEAGAELDEELRAQGPDGPAALHWLAMSGGAADGAFGAGLLCGWSEAGTRPSFQGVSGVSTGALAAPFVFLGPEYDGLLERFYTEIRAEQLLDRRSWLSIPGSTSLADMSIRAGMK